MTPRRKPADDTPEGFDNDDKASVEEIAAGLETALAEGDAEPGEDETPAPVEGEPIPVEVSGTATTDTPTPAWLPPEEAPEAPPPPKPGSYT